MFERLGEICANKEVYLTDLDHDEVPALFWWFPNQDDYQPPPPADESVAEKLERISNTLKSTRNEITDILHGSDLAEDKIIRAMEIRQETDILIRLLRDCERDPASKSGPAAEQLSKCKASLAEFEAAVKNMDTLKFANSMKVEAEFKGGLSHQLIPWLNSAEKSTSVVLEKPKSFCHAQEVEKQCATFAKEVRAVNKTLTRIEELAKMLDNNKTTAEQQIEEQKLRFKKIAEVAATRVEHMRDLLIRWQELTNSEATDSLDFQPLTQFLKCYGIYFHE